MLQRSPNLNRSSKTSVILSVVEGPRSSFPAPLRLLLRRAVKAPVYHPRGPSVITSLAHGRFAEMLGRRCVAVSGQRGYGDAAPSLRPEICWCASATSVAGPSTHARGLATAQDDRSFKKARSALVRQTRADEPRNNGCGALGLDKNSGWNWLARNHGMVPCSSIISTSVPSGEVPAMMTMLRLRHDARDSRC